MKPSPESVLAGVPGWQQAGVRELKGGLSNQAWLVEAEGRKAVLKIDEAPRRAPFNSREAEARIQMLAAEHGLANRVLHVSDTVYLTEYLDGSVLARENFYDDANLADVAEALRKLHTLPLTGRVFDAREAAQQYADAATDADPEMVDKHLRIIEAVPVPKTLAFCHNDLVAENILATPGIRFLDWEYACDNDPLFDLATIVAHHELSDERRDLLLDAYFDGAGSRHSKRLAEYERLYRSLLWLWSAASG